MSVGQIQIAAGKVVINAAAQVARVGAGLSLHLQICVDRHITVTFGIGADNNKFRLVVGSRLGESSEYACGFAGGCVAANDPNSTFLVDGVEWVASWFTAGGDPIPVGDRPDDGAYTDWYTMGGGKTFAAPIFGVIITTGRGPVTDPTDSTVLVNDDNDGFPDMGGQSPYNFTICW